MQRTRVRKALACATALALVAVAGSAQAQVTGDDAKCRAAIQKTAGKLGATANKVIDGCIKNQLKGKESASKNCNSLAAADTKGKAGKAAAKVTATVGGAKTKCDDTTHAAVLALFPSCPSPANAADNGGATTGTDTFAELGACQADINTDGIEPLRNYILNPDAAGIIANANAKALIKCATTIGKNATKLWATVSKERGKCQATSDKGGGAYAYGCSTQDPKGKISSTTQKLKDGVTKSCTGLTEGELGLVGTCANDTASIGNCVSAAVVKNASGATATAFEFGGVCPTEVVVSINGSTGPGTTPDLHLNNTLLSAGWTGLGHDADVVDGFVGRVNLACSDADCGTCAVTASCAEGNCRCENNSSIQCNTPFVTDAVCGGNLCVVHFGPPLALAAGGVATCVVNTIRTAFNGTADIGTGSSSTPITNNSKVHVSGTQVQPCPVCSGATIGATGTCDTGPRVGLACTTDAVNTTFGNVSYDCPPDPGTNVTGAGINIPLTLTDAAVSQPGQDPCDSPLGTLTCNCGSCDLNPLQPCKTDADCGGAGPCNNGSGPPRQPNSCGDLTCTDTGDGINGVCNAGPTDTFCDAIVKADGAGYIPCLDDASCAPLSAGACTLTTQRPCFLDPIDEVGLNGTDGAELVAVTCTASTGAAPDAAAGLPGPVRVKLDFDFTGLCSDGVTEFELGGSNCP